MRSRGEWSRVARLSRDALTRPPRLLALAALGLGMSVATLALVAGAGAENQGYLVRFFNVTPRGGDPISDDLVVAEEESAQEFLYARTGLMFRVQSYQPTAFRLAETGDEVAPLDIRLVERLGEELKAAGYNDPRVRNFAFYSGSLGAGRTAGSASGDTGMVWFRGGGTAFVVVHELFHTFGIVPSCAAHTTGSAHVLDDANDLMRSEADPAASGSSTGIFVVDANHDDYYNPTLGPDGKTAVAIGNCPASLNLANMPWVTPGLFSHLRLNVVGKGYLEIGSGKFCYGTCDDQKVTGTTYTLTPNPDDGWHLAGWGGACGGNGTCSVTLDADKAVSATFVRDTVKVTLKVVGRGRVKGLFTSGKACSARCSRSLPAGTKVSLAAVPAPGWRFRGWKGCPARCVFPASARAITATFGSR
jgi:hypothetical protein